MHEGESNERPREAMVGRRALLMGGIYTLYKPSVSKMYGYLLHESRVNFNAVVDVLVIVIVPMVVLRVYHRVRVTFDWCRVVNP